MLFKNVVLVHDFLVQMGGAERVVAAFTRIFPTSSLYVSLTRYKSLSDDFRDVRIYNTFLQLLPFKGKLHKIIFPLYPVSFALLNIPRSTEIVIVSCTTFSKFISTHASVKKVLYCHNMPRFFYDESYIRGVITNSFLRSLARFIFPIIKYFDRKVMSSYDLILSNSRNVQNRLHCFYDISSVVVHPPVNLSRFIVSNVSSGYFLVLSRLLSYKRIDLVVNAFRNLPYRLMIVGDGPELNNLRTMATDNIEFTGKLSDSGIVEAYKHCSAVIFPGEEDFGIVPLEANACGKPVIAFAKGGALETVIDNQTGILFPQQNEASLSFAIEKFFTADWDPHFIREHAEKFSESNFEKSIKNYVSKML
jgi:glycosyltransferase involved in cell wall biosynthesis